MWPRAILFDLDDTLFDHQRASTLALGAMHAAHAPDLPFEPFANKHAEVLEIFHARFLAGEFTLDQARVARMQSLFAAFERDIDAATAIEAAQRYRESHQANRHLVPGTIELLDRVREHCRLGVVTNNSTIEQIEKLRALNIASYFDTVVISEDVGITKPDPRIFEIALERVGAHAHEAVFIGDNWTNDVVGAIKVGMAAVWLSREGKTCSSRFPLHREAVSQAIHVQIETPVQPPATADITGQKWPDSRTDVGVLSSRIVTINALTPITQAISAIQTAFKNRTVGAIHNEQLETLAP